MAPADLRNESTPDGSTYVRPQDMDWKPTRFEGITIKVLYEDCVILAVYRKPNVFRSSAGF